MTALLTSLFILCSSLTIVFSGSIPKSRATPAWDSAYAVTGTLRLPYAELEEPFSAWYDGKKSRSRIDFYGGIVQTFMRGDVGEYGGTYKVAYMTNQTNYNYKRCFQTEGSQDAPVEAQTVLPDLTDFDMIEKSAMVDNVEVDVWYNEVVSGQKTSKYTMYITSDEQKPHKYEMYGYDSLLGSHFDKYYVEYHDYTAGEQPDTAFEVPINNTCDGFPGPGNAESRILLNPMREYINRDDSHHQEMFGKFKKLHNKDYSDATEHSRREAIFRQNVRFIHSKNRSPINYTLAVNHMADMSHDELRLRNGRRPSKGPNHGRPFNRDAYKSPMPDSFDWRLYGAVTPVKDQAVCGSCWSFGTTGTIEGAYFLATGKLVRLSQQELMDCSWGYGNNACDGGEDFRAYDWIMNNKGGLATEDDYGSYKAVDFMCNSRNVSGTVQISSYTNITSGDQIGLQFALFNHGPISVAIDASHLSLSFYANGVYYEEKCRNDEDGLDHAVLAVGYGVMNGQDYWLIKNSWSTYWGNDGYVLMSKKDNNCGVATSATFVQISK
ncbi:digestive cysteine proteinase 2-like [Watersipora subatra]|uniref:digestive cysteine proteinase 2-like n=1 Tax=Watersipora subatra TaxID=2589382 RepID=UPI00355BFC9D